MAMDSMIELTTPDGHKFSAYRADPDEPPKGTIIVLPDAASTREKARKVANDFAADGYLAIAPALSDHPAQEEATTATNESAETNAQAAAAQLVAELQTTVDSIKDCGKVAVIGFGAGGGLAYAAANLVGGLACAVSYYGTGIVDNHGAKRKIPMLLHFGEADAAIPAEAVNQFKAYRPEVSAFSYPGAAHAFDADGTTSYDEPAAQLALDRTMAWISQYVVGAPPAALKNAGAYALAKVDKKKKKKADDDMGPPME